MRCVRGISEAIRKDISIFLGLFHLKTKPFLQVFFPVLFTAIFLFETFCREAEHQLQKALETKSSPKRWSRRVDKLPLFDVGPRLKQSRGDKCAFRRNVKKKQLKRKL